MKKYYYHYTNRENFNSISKSLKIDSESGINFVCPTIEDCMEFISFYDSIGFISGEDSIIIKFTTDTLLQQSTDHNANVIKAKALCSYDPIRIKKIVDVYSVGVKK